MRQVPIKVPNAAIRDDHRQSSAGRSRQYHATFACRVSRTIPGMRRGLINKTDASSIATTELVMANPDRDTINAYITLIKKEEVRSLYEIQPYT